MWFIFHNFYTSSHLPKLAEVCTQLRANFKKIFSTLSWSIQIFDKSCARESYRTFEVVYGGKRRWISLALEKPRFSKEIKSVYLIFWVRSLPLLGWTGEYFETQTNGARTQRCLIPSAELFAQEGKSWPGSGHSEAQFSCTMRNRQWVYWWMCGLTFYRPSEQFIECFRQTRMQLPGQQCWPWAQHLGLEQSFATLKHPC